MISCSEVRPPLPRGSVKAEASTQMTDRAALGRPGSMRSASFCELLLDAAGLREDVSESGSPFDLLLLVVSPGGIAAEHEGT